MQDEELSYTNIRGLFLFYRKGRIKRLWLLLQMIHNYLHCVHILFKLNAYNQYIDS